MECSRFAKAIATLGVAIAAAFLWAGCESQTPPTARTTASASASVPLTSSKKPRALFALTFNGKHLRNVLVMKGKPRKLREMATAKARNVKRWRSLVVTAAGKETRIGYGPYTDGHEARLHLDAKGHVHLGIYPAGETKPEREIANVTALDIVHDEVAGPPMVHSGASRIPLVWDVTKGLTIVAKGKDGKKGGVRLLDVLQKLDSSAKIGSVTIDDQKLCREALDGKTKEVLLRKNRRGMIFVEVWLPSDGNKANTRLRDMATLVISPDPC